MGTLYIDTGGATTNSGSTDQNAPDLSGTGDAVVTGSVVQLTLGTDLSGVVTAAGPTQSTIYIAQASNTNQKIFWITAVDDALDQVTVSVAPTGVTASNWAIGGRMVLTPANYEAAPRAGDLIKFNNSPAASTAALITSRTSGNKTDGYIRWKGKDGVRPVLNTTNTATVIATGSTAYVSFENFEIDQDGATGSAILAGNGTAVSFYNIKISDAGGSGLALSGSFYHNYMVFEISGGNGIGVSVNSGTAGQFMGFYIHDNVTDGWKNITSAQIGTITNSIIESNGGRGIYSSGAIANALNIFKIDGVTVYGNGDSGLEVTDADLQIVITNSIFSDNGNAAGEYNVEWVAGAAENGGWHAWNCFYHQGGGGGANLLNLTVNSFVANSEITTDPLFTNPGAGDFSLQSTSPCKATGFPGQFLGGSLGYMDMGAVQRQEPTAGAITGYPASRLQLGH